MDFQILQNNIEHYELNHKLIQNDIENYQPEKTRTVNRHKQLVIIQLMPHLIKWGPRGSFIPFSSTEINHITNHMIEIGILSSVKDMNIKADLKKIEECSSLLNDLENLLNENQKKIDNLR